MEYVKTGDKYIVTLSEGENVKTELTTFLKDHNIFAGLISCIGSVQDPSVSFFNLKKKEYDRKKLSGAYEVVNLAGNISTKKGVPYLHMYAALASSDFSIKGGHFHNATVNIALECVIETLGISMARNFDEDTGQYILEP